VEGEGRNRPARAPIRLPATAHMPTAYSLRAPPSTAQQRLRLPPPPLPLCPAGGGAARRRRVVGVASASASPFDELYARGRPAHGPSKVSHRRLPRVHRPNDQPFSPKLNSSSWVVCNPWISFALILLFPCRKAAACNNFLFEI
jgi:hypothetical protein